MDYAKLGKSLRELGAATDAFSQSMTRLVSGISNIKPLQEVNMASAMNDAFELIKDLAALKRYAEEKNDPELLRLEKIIRERSNQLSRAYTELNEIWEKTERVRRDPRANQGYSFGPVASGVKPPKKPELRTKTGF